MRLNDKPACFSGGCRKPAKYRITHSMDCVTLFCDRHGNALQNDINKFIDLCSRGIMDASVKCEDCGAVFEIEAMSIRPI